jgi:hypothetical protein
MKHESGTRDEYRKIIAHFVAALAGAHPKCQALADITVLQVSSARIGSLAKLRETIKDAMYGMPKHIQFNDKTAAGNR